MLGRLYVIATPIGNLKDMTFRAVDTLKAVDLIACEDTRSAQVLLSHYNIKKPLTSFFEGNERAKTPDLVRRLKEGQNLGLISECGTPTISDPGYRLVKACREEGLAVEAIPGPSAVVAALSIAGLPTDAFIFEGFLSIKSSTRLRKMKSWLNEERTIVFYASPHKLLRILDELLKTFGDIHLVVLREMTKRFEEAIQGPVAGILEKYQKERIRGEFVILLNPKLDKKRLCVKE